MPQPQPPPQPVAGQINIEVPAELDATYANFALITHSPSEVIIDFARVLPNTPRAKVCARMLMTPMHAKLLLMALSENLQKYEDQFGPIVIPQSGNLAQQLFRPPRPNE